METIIRTCDCIFYCYVLSVDLKPEFIFFCSCGTVLRDLFIQFSFHMSRNVLYGIFNENEFLFLFLHYKYARKILNTSMS